MKYGYFKSRHLELMVWVLSVSALIVCAALEYISQYRAGVMRHMFYRKIEHLAGPYSSEMLVFHTGIASALVIYALFKGLTKQISVLKISSLTVLPILLVTALYSQQLEELYSYTYILLSLETGMLAIAALPLAKDALELFSRVSQVRSAR